MEITYEKLAPNKLYSKTFFAILPRFTKNKVFWLTNVRKEVEVINNKTVVTYSRGYDGVIYFTDKQVVFNPFIILNRFVLRIS